jgi:hypothetical protein
MDFSIKGFGNQGAYFALLKTDCFITLRVTDFGRQYHNSTQVIQLLYIITAGSSD